MNLKIKEKQIVLGFVLSFYLIIGRIVWNIIIPVDFILKTQVNLKIRSKEPRCCTTKKILTRMYHAK